jgi:hypothetical protein
MKIDSERERGKERARERGREREKEEREERGKNIKRDRCRVVNYRNRKTEKSE